MRLHCTWLYPVNKIVRIFWRNAHYFLSVKGVPVVSQKRFKWTGRFCWSKQVTYKGFDPIHEWSRLRPTKGSAFHCFLFCSCNSAKENTNWTEHIVIREQVNNTLINSPVCKRYCACFSHCTMFLIVFTIIFINTLLVGGLGWLCTINITQHLLPSINICSPMPTFQLWKSNQFYQRLIVRYFFTDSPPATCGNFHIDQNP